MNSKKHETFIVDGTVTGYDKLYWCNSKVGKEFTESEDEL